jgi:hypothetical protein
MQKKIIRLSAQVNKPVTGLERSHAGMAKPHRLSAQGDDMINEAFECGGLAIAVDSIRPVPIPALAVVKGREPAIGPQASSDKGGAQTVAPSFWQAQRNWIGKRVNGILTRHERGDDYVV